MPNPRVVVADDHDETRALIASILASEFDVVATVADGRAAEEACAALRPDLVVIHKSALFHAMNERFNFDYPPAGETPKKEWQDLYDIADRDLIAFLGMVATTNPRTKFLVYSRGTDGHWQDDAYRMSWVAQASERFPALKGRIETQYIVGGVDKGSFDDSVVIEKTRKNVRKLLGLPEPSP